MLVRKKKVLDEIQKKVIACNLCPRLRVHCQTIAQVKRRAYRDWDYWGSPVPSFGDPRARLLIVGLAPGAHGANRTGRMFTGDASGDFLYSVLHETGFASQPWATHRDDGLELLDAYITASVRCAPPGNKPTGREFEACRPYLEKEFVLLENVRVVVVLGRLALDAYLAALMSLGRITRRSLYPFGHGTLYRLPDGLPRLLCSYHPSRQNTQTGRLTRLMLLKIFRRARRLVGEARKR